jgi:hypothetical protein
MIESEFILDILNLLLDGDEKRKAFLPQIDYLTDSEYEYTGAGLFVTFRSSEKILIYRVESAPPVLDGVAITSSELNDLGASAILFIKDGIIDCLEIFSYDGGYPRKELTSYTLKQEEDYS